MESLQQSMRQNRDQSARLRRALYTGEPGDKAGMALLQFLAGGSDERFIHEFAPAAHARSFCAALICIDRYARFQEKFSWQEQAEFKNAALRATAAFAAKNGISACGAPQADGRIAFLFCSDERDAENFQYRLGQVLKEAAAWSSRRLVLSVSVSAGYPTHELRSVHACYRQALEATGYRLCRGEGCVILVPHARRAALTRPQPPCEEVAVSIRQGDDAKTTRLLADFTAQIRQCVVSDYAVRAAYLDLLETLCAAPAQQCAHDERFEHVLSAFERMDTLEEIDALIREEANAARARSSARMRERILSAEDLEQFVEAYYADSSLDISVMVTKLGVSYSSARLLFKEYFGMSFLDCINLRRIAKAKEFLRMSGMTLKEIAAQVGYNNDQSFTRFFKKYEKVTPGEYRKLVCQGACTSRRSA